MAKQIPLDSPRLRKRSSKKKKRRRLLSPHLLPKQRSL